MTRYHLKISFLSLKIGIFSLRNGNFNDKNDILNGKTVQNAVFNNKILFKTSSISVECKPPACREYRLHKIGRDVDILLSP